MSKTKRIFLSLPAIIFAVVIFIVSNGPMPDLPKLGIQWEDKILHFIAYAFLGFSTILFIKANFQKLNKKQIIIWSIIITSIYGLSDEIHQYYVPGRYSEFLDWFADFLGACFSAGIFMFLKNKVVKIDEN